jgi:putative transposase
MSHYRRLYIPGACYFFTVVTHDRSPLLINNIDRLRTSFQYAQQRLPFTIEAIVILPDHLHCLWTLPENDKDFSSRWRLLKYYFARGIETLNNKRKEKPIWQRRFWEHLIRNEADWCRHMDYIHYNPVKHGLASSPREWQFSSFSRCVKEGLYDTNWGRSDNDYHYENLNLE